MYYRIAIIVTLLIIILVIGPRHWLLPITVGFIGGYACTVSNVRNETAKYTAGYSGQKSSAQLMIITDITKDLLAITNGLEDSLADINSKSIKEINSYVGDVLKKINNCDGLCERKKDRIKANLQRLVKIA